MKPSGDKAHEELVKKLKRDLDEYVAKGGKISVHPLGDSALDENGNLRSRVTKKKGKSPWG